MTVSAFSLIFNMESATLFASGWFHVAKRRINSIRVVFDPRPIVELYAKKQSLLSLHLDLAAIFVVC